MRGNKVDIIHYEYELSIYNRKLIHQRVEKIDYGWLTYLVRLFLIFVGFFLIFVVLYAVLVGVRERAREVPEKIMQRARLSHATQQPVERLYRDSTKYNNTSNLHRI